MTQGCSTEPVRLFFFKHLLLHYLFLPTVAQLYCPLSAMEQEFLYSLFHMPEINLSIITNFIFT